MSYPRLEQLLSTQSWLEADEETVSILLRACGKVAPDRLTPEDIESFPCEVLHDIDKLWAESSGGFFGLSIQSSIWQEQDRNYTAFCKEVEWQASNQHQNSNLIRTRGHHPQLFNFLNSAFVAEPGVSGSRFLSRLAACGL